MKTKLLYIVLAVLPLFVFAAPASADLSTDCNTLLSGNYDTTTHTCTLTVTTTINSGVVVEVLDGQILDIPSGITLNNYGTIAIDNGGTVNIDAGGSIYNKYGGINNIGFINNNGTISNNIGSAINNDGTIYSYGIINNDATVNNFGIINNYAGGTINNNAHGTIGNAGTFSDSGTINNNGLINDGGTSTIIIYSDGIINNNAGGIINNNADGEINIHGIINNNNGGTISNDAVLNNYAGGVINNNAGGTSTINNNADGTFNNSGIINNDNNIYNYGGTINNDNNIINDIGSIFNEPGGTINNNGGGTIRNTHIIDNAGIINNNVGGKIDNTFQSLGGFPEKFAVGIINNNAGGTINNDGLIDNDNYINNNAGGIINNNAGGVINNNGCNSCSLGLPNGNILNDGTINNDGILNNTGNIDNFADGTINNDGIINNNTGGTINNDGTINNGGGTINNDGTFNNLAGGTINNLADGIINNSGNIINSGTFNNSGTINHLCGGTITGTISGNPVQNECGSIAGVKFNDLNGDGVRQTGEPGLANWTITLTNSTGATKTQLTAPDGSYNFTNLTGDNYTVGEVIQPGWIQTAPAVSATGSATYTVNTSGGKDATGKDFGNFQLGSVSGTKFQDLNANGVRDSGEVGLAGWNITINGTDTITGATVNQTVITNASGAYSFSGLTAGTYTISEQLLPGWVQTAPATGTYTVTITSGAVITGQDFGNFHKGKITGGGWINITGDPRATFVIVGQYPDSSNTAQGNVEYQDHNASLNIQSINITTVATTLDKKKGTITGYATVNGAGSYPFVVYVEDNAEPGKGADVFKISLPTYPYSNGAVLSGGNIQIFS